MGLLLTHWVGGLADMAAEQHGQRRPHSGASVSSTSTTDDGEEDIPAEELMQEWFNVVHEKNVLVRYQSELMVQ